MFRIYPIESSIVVSENAGIGCHDPVHNSVYPVPVGQTYSLSLRHEYRALDHEFTTDDGRVHAPINDLNVAFRSNFIPKKSNSLSKFLNDA